MNTSGLGSVLGTLTRTITPITQNLPAPVRELGVSLIDEKCYSSLVEMLDFSDIELKDWAIAIVVGGSIVKIPQILLILRAQDSTGLSLPSYILETLSYLITLFYSYRNSFPFSTYGENFFLGIQNIIVSLLTIAYGNSPNPSRTTGDTGLVLGLFIAAIAALNSLSLENLAYLQLATLPLSLFSKVPQITANYSAKSTGRLSAFAVISQVLGCIARVYTTSTELGDPVVQAGFGLALLLNLVLGIQMLMYWGNAPPVANKKVEKKKAVALATEVEPIDETLSQEYFLSNGDQNTSPRQSKDGRQRKSTPMRRVEHAEGSSRKWERKVD
ncbi:mannose-P-dolichol utilization defect 1 protein [Gymnopus androsaceus JB14]|uniref:Mannose-P-dolichol utilization defect 1 protein n=1 Tax=Gymnopus androsaceus JB14 TaxID=1447944 RepID=A0A6A4H7W1_9AGAR|nr:mannose-P-dolichol utilization defect 1 protein [Gymnopus androsaceus JB14]